MDQPKFLMLCGLAGSGKSTFAEALISATKVEDVDVEIAYLSSDAIRLELFGDESSQENNAVVFEEMRKRTLEAMKKGKFVIYDATNISRKKRSHLLRQLPKNSFKTIVYLTSNLEIAQSQNLQRERVVPFGAIERMYKNLQIPIYSEGWNKIIFEYDDETLNNEFPKQFSDAVRLGVSLGREGYDLMNFLSTYFNEFSKVMDLAQDSKYHSFSVSRHTYYVYKHVLDNYNAENEREREIMLWTALLHDLGKHLCKSFINRKGEEVRYANFIGHEHVGSQIAIRILKRLGFDESFIHTVSLLIQFHMFLLDDKANPDKLKNHVGEDHFKRLEFLREADTLAH
ncbi:AAA family ATPase [Halobacillus rhizosphaerae]|uniref:AAA family ATPase n=1 Tax=Halobacillus rhizosphaerae TaxID=3064889 RepID=UPI00398B2D2E